jgi:hypothetical protein
MADIRRNSVDINVWKDNEICKHIPAVFCDNALTGLKSVYFRRLLPEPPGGSAPGVQNGIPHHELAVRPLFPHIIGDYSQPRPGPSMKMYPIQHIHSCFNILLLAASLPAFFTGCGSAAKLPVKQNEHMEVGWTPRSIFQSPSYAAWFDTTYARYTPDPDAVKQLSGMQDSVDLVVIFGTWCSDSRREVPRFWKIMDSCHFPAARIVQIAVDRTMEIPVGIRKLYTITNVPTFIVHYRGVEMGRITESPRVTLEQDIVNLLAPLFPR